MTIREVLSDIHALQRQMLDFESRYGVRSDVFYAAYRTGEEPANDAWVLDFSEWAGVYEAWLERQAEYRAAIDLERRGSVGIAGLVHAA
jgi:hypothetical protein